MLHLHALITHPPGSHFTSDPPLHLLTRLIPQANIAYCEKPWGTVLLQELVINGITIGKYSFDLNEHCEISINFSKPLAVLQYTMEGFMEPGSSMNNFLFRHLQHGLFYLPAGQSITLKFAKGRYNFWQVHFTLSLINKFTFGQPGFTHFHQPDNAISAFNSTVLPIDKKTKTMLSLLNQHLMESPLNAYYVNRRCMHLLMRFINEHDHFQTKQKKMVAKEKQHINLEELIRDQLTNPANKVPTTKALAQKLHLSIFQLNKQSHETYSLSTSSLIAKVRMDTAVSLLAKKNLSVNEISIRVGYQDISSFTRAFKKRFGFPPSQFFDK